MFIKKVLLTSVFGIVMTIVSTTHAVGDLITPGGTGMTGGYACTVTYVCGDGAGASHSYTNTNSNNLIITVSENTTCSKTNATFSHWAVTSRDGWTPTSSIAYPGDSYDTEGCSDDSGTNLTFTAVYNDGASVPAAKSYVDTQVATKQLKIPAAGQSGVGAGETVMTYTANGNGEIGERGLYSDTRSYDATLDGDKLITASALNDTFTNLPTTDTTKLECANPGTCDLWTIVDQTAYSILPAGYTQLEYIESTGTQYIDTGVKGNLNTKLELDFALLETEERNIAIYGSSNQQNETAFVLSTNSTGSYIFPQFDTVTRNTVSNLRFILGQKYHSVHSKDGWYYDDTLGARWSNPTEFETPSNIRLFSTSVISKPATARIWYVKIWDGNTLVRNLIPAKNSSNVVGMYDTVTGTFFTNAGTGEFIAGPEM